MTRPARVRALAAATVLALAGAAAALPARAAWVSHPDARADAPAIVPPGVRVLRDIAYGPDPRQRLDVYEPPAGARAMAPASAASAPRTGGAPLLFVVHGGGWRRGDKAQGRVVTNKVAHWTALGWVVVSIDYRMLPDTPVLAQAGDVARALAAVQARAAGWGADPDRIVLLGHSAGAHLVAWLAAGGAPPAGVSLRPWRGAVLLDSAAFDVSVIMRLPHLPLYDEAFGHDPAMWRRASPDRQLARPMPPLLAVCDTHRRLSCPLARRFAARAQATGTRVDVRPEDLTHAQINETLGLTSDYTAAVDAFIASLRP